MVAESGARLLDDDAREAVVETLLPLVTVATPNIPEARVLSGLGDDATQEDLARAVQMLGPDAVVVTGGHSAALVDLFFDGDEPVEIPGERHEGAAAHGSGCTHSSAIAAFLARGAEPLQAAAAARQVASLAVGAGLEELGEGHGPVDVFGLAAAAAERRLTQEAK
jgi:hydroxymethylpyrimidine/phosphomethylpyrimidine kinase